MERLKWKKGNFWNSAGDIVAQTKMQDKTGKETIVVFQIIQDDWGTKKKWVLNMNWQKVENFKNKTTAKKVAELIFSG